jgi:hypothetical protein
MTSSRPTDLRSTLHSIAERAAYLCEADDAAILRVEDDHFWVSSHYGSLSPVSVGQPFPIREDWVSGRALTERTAVNVRDMLSSSTLRLR